MTMVEKVARAFCLEEGGDPDAITIHQQPQWKIWESHARAAIEAMREPSADMLKVAPIVEHNHYWPSQKPTEHTWKSLPTMLVAKLWRAMIDAALADEKAQA